VCAGVPHEKGKAQQRKKRKEAGVRAQRVRAAPLSVARKRQVTAARPFSTSSDGARS